MENTLSFQLPFSKLAVDVSIWWRCAAAISMYRFVFPLHGALRHNWVSLTVDCAWEMFWDTVSTWSVWFAGFVTLCGKSWVFVHERWLHANPEAVENHRASPDSCKKPHHKTMCLLRLWTRLLLETAKYFGKVMAKFQVTKKTWDLIVSISQGNKEKDTPYCGILIFLFSRLLHYFLKLDMMGKSCTVCSGNWSSIHSLGKLKAARDSY